MTHDMRDSEAGFSLLEVLVALAVLSVGAVSLLTATQTYVARVSEIENRTVARWVANDRLAALRIGVEQPDIVDRMSQRWGVSVERSGTDDADLARVDIAVGLVADDRALYRLTGFVDLSADAQGVSR